MTEGDAGAAGDRSKQMSIGSEIDCVELRGAAIAPCTPSRKVNLKAIDTEWPDTIRHERPTCLVGSGLRLHVWRGGRGQPPDNRNCVVLGIKQVTRSVHR